MFKCGVQMGDRFTVGAAADRLFGGSAQILGGAGAIAAAIEVQGELTHVFGDRRAVSRFEPLTDSPVEPAAPPGRHVVVHHPVV
jgi:hypothetical protein